MNFFICSDEMSDVEFLKVDIDEQQEAALDAEIKVVPTFVVYKDGAQASKVRLCPKMVSHLVSLPSTRYNPPQL